MRILRVAQKLYPDVKGGAPYHVHAMSRDQAALGHDVTVLTVRADSELPHVEEREGYTVVRYDPSVNLLGNDISIGVAQYLANADDFDVIHAHSHLYFSTNLAAIRRRLGGPPLAITNHGLFSQTAPEWIFEAYLRTLGRWTFESADVLFCYTDADQNRLREYGVTSDIAVVSNGVDTERFTPNGPRSELLNSGGPVLLFVGRLVDGKRPQLAVEALAGLLKEFPNAELYLCGKGPLRAELEALARELGVAASVTFLGQIRYEEMPHVYRSADVLILPSRAEGVPRTIMEALATGVPVVCTDLPPIRAAFGEAVAYFDGDVEMLVRVVEDLFAKGCAVELADRFRWKHTVQETIVELERIGKDG